MTYILLAAAFIVWGGIVYRVFFSNATVVDTTILERVDSTSKKITKARHELILDYRDPFSDSMRIPVAIKDTVRENVIETQLPLEDLIDWSVIRYTGLIRNPSVKKNIVLININNKDYMFKEGINNQGVTLLKSDDFYIRVQYQGATKDIYK